MNLKTDGYLARFYMWSYDESAWELPTNLCPFFWKLVWAAVSFFPTLLGTLAIGIFHYYFEGHGFDTEAEMVDRWLATAGVVLGLGLLLAVGAGVYTAPFTMLFGTLGICIAIGVIILLNRKAGREVVSVAKEFVKAKKSRFCPSITWEEADVS